MEKTTKKKKSKKGLKKRIGIIAVGGLSLILTVCLSVGATLAWFAGSSWSSQSLFMGGPVYVEMAGRGNAKFDGSTGQETDAKWRGGAGHLDIQAATARNTGTAGDKNLSGANKPGNVLLPGERYEVYSQARVYSTAYTDSTTDNPLDSNSSGADVKNTSYGDGTGTVHYRSDGRVTTATTSVLRARFSVSFEFDPYVGFNNFKDVNYAKNYPVKSGAYEGAYYAVGTPAVTKTDAENTGDTPKADLLWSDALGANYYNSKDEDTGDLIAGTRRDAVPAVGADRDVDVYPVEFTNETKDTDILEEIKNGTKKSIYAWKFVSKSVWDKAHVIDTAVTNNQLTKVDGKNKFLQMGAPFNGDDPTAGGVGYYGVWILADVAGDSTKLQLTESEAFYSERCDSYLGSYAEEYYTEYGGLTNRQVNKMLREFETDLNNSFINLINDSSDEIHAGNVLGMTSEDGVMTYLEPEEEELEVILGVLDQDYGAKNGANDVASSASWLYINPSIGNDTNTNELSTQNGGWWYLVSSTANSVSSAEYRVWKENDVKTAATDIDGDDEPDLDSVTATIHPVYGSTADADKPVYADDTFAPHANYMTTEQAIADKDTLLSAKLYEVTPNIVSKDADGNPVLYGADGSGVFKTVSYSFPFVNGPNYLPTSLTNIFANAKITFQVTFQALQAFFPWSKTIDGLSYKSPIMGTAKALNIGNAIPIFNEAFAYEY